MNKQYGNDKLIRSPFGMDKHFGYTTYGERIAETGEQRDRTKEAPVLKLFVILW